MPADWAAQAGPHLLAMADAAGEVATRRASQLALDVLAPLLPEFFGRSADLTASNLTNFKGCVLAGRDRPATTWRSACVNSVWPR